MVHGNLQASTVLRTPNGVVLTDPAVVLRASHGPEGLPERVEGQLPDASADIWGLGRILKHLAGPLHRRDPLRFLVRDMTEWMPEERETDLDRLDRRLDEAKTWTPSPGLLSRLLTA